MIWQDIVLSIGSFIFTIVLVPQLIDCMHGGYMNYKSAILTATVLGIFCIVYATLGMWLAAIPHTVSIWFAIGILSWRNLRRLRDGN